MKELIRLMDEVANIASSQHIRDEETRRCLLSLAIAVKKIACCLASEEGDRC